MLIESVDGPVTTREITAFKDFMQAQPLPTDNDHNAMVYGSAGAAVEALGTMYEVTKDRAILDRMIEFTDAMLAARNDPKTGRVLWTGERDLAWPNKRPGDADAKYSGSENGDVIGHIAYAALLILRDPTLWTARVGGGDPHGWGATYSERARSYVRELDRSIDTFVLKWFVDPKTLHYRWPESERYATLGARADKSRGKGIPWNQQMMLNNGFQRLAECHEALGDDAGRVRKYDAIVKTSCDWFFNELVRYRAHGVDCYKWSYATDDRTLKYTEDTAHAGYDILVYRAFASGRYGIPREAMQPFANTLRFVIARGPGQFAGRVDGSGKVRGEVGSAWLNLADFDPEIYRLIAVPALRAARTKPDLTARILWWKQRRWQQRRAAANDPDSPAAREVHVSPQGDDHNPGTAERPVRTLARARDLVRGMNTGAAADVVVVLHDGTYRLAAPMVLTPQDSGREDHPIVYRAADGAHPVISGGIQVTGWKEVDAGKNLWAAPAPEGLTNTRQLYVNGLRSPRVRGRLPVTLKQTEDGYEASSPIMASWRNPQDMEFVYTGGNALWSEPSVALGPWTEPRCPIATIQGTHIIMAQPAWNNSTRRVMLPPGKFKRPANLVGPASIAKKDGPTYVENAYELLGTPGQWYFDRAARMIYYVPRAGENLATADVEAPALEALVIGEGTAEHPIHDLTFEGLQFSYATWLFPSTNEGFPEIQANYLVTGPEGYAKQGLGDLVPGGTHPFGDWTKTPGNVRFGCSQRLVFRHNTFTHLGGAGLDLGDGSQSDLAEGNIFTDISANGIELGGVDKPLATGGDITRDNVIRNNHVYAVAVEFHGGIGICVGYAQRTRIEHNQLDHLPYTGISIGWGGWPDKIEQAGVANFSRDNVIAQNLIFKHMLLLADGAAIYTQGLTGPSLAEGEKVIGNVIYDQYGSGHGIYTDNGCKNVTANGNVIFHTNHDNWGSRHKDYYNGQHGENYDAFAFTGNYWQQGDADVAEKAVTLNDNHLISALSDVPPAVIAAAGLEPGYRDLLDRQVGAVTAPEAPFPVQAAIAGDRAVVAWNPTLVENGAPVTSYTVTASNGAKATITADEFWRVGYIRLAGFAANMSYTFTVAATNAQGTSVASLPSYEVKPEAKTVRPPHRPENMSLHASDGRVSVHFQAPNSAGGALITAYEFTINPGRRTQLLTGRRVLTLGGRHATFDVVSGLEPGKTYTIGVSAVNSAGKSAAAEKTVVAR